MPQYNDEFKERVVRKMMAPNARSVAQVSRETGVSEQSLYNWRNKYRQRGVNLVSSVFSKCCMMRQSIVHSQSRELFQKGQITRRSMFIAGRGRQNWLDRAYFRGIYEIFGGQFQNLL